MDKAKLNITSINGNGLGQKPKRIPLIKWLKSNHRGIFLIQETHSTLKTQSAWIRDLGHQYKAYFSHGTSGTNGVCTAIPKNLAKYVEEVKNDD